MSAVTESGLPLAVAESPQPREMVISGGRGRISREGLRELWASREVLWAFAVRHVKVKYKQALIGMGWAVLQPVIAAVIFSVFLGHVAKFSSEGAPYLLFALSGMVPWTYFSTATTTSADALVNNQALLRKVHFPREVLPLAMVTASLADFLAALAVLMVGTMIDGIAPSIVWLALPLPIILLVVSTAALGLAVSALNVYYRDVRYIVPFLIQLGLFATPVIWSATQVPAKWRSTYLVLNPIGAAIDGVRRIFLHHQWPDLTVSAISLGWAVCGLVLAYMVFQKLERGFADRA